MQQIAKVRFEFTDAPSHADIGVGRCGGHDQVKRQTADKDHQQYAVADRDGQLVNHRTACDGSGQNCEQGEQFDGAVGFDKPFARENLRQNAVLARAIDARADADDEVADAFPDVTGPNSTHGHHAADKFKRVAEGKRASLGETIAEEAGQRG